MRRLSRFICFLGAGLCAASFFGDVHPALDTLALGRPLFVVLCLIGALFVLRRTHRAALFGIGFIGAVSIVSPMQAGSDDGDFRLYVKNMRHKHADIDALVQDILDQSVDAVFLQEVPTAGSRVAWALRTQFPHQHTCPYGVGHALVVLSKSEFTAPGQCTRSRVLAAAQIIWQDTPVWLVSTHIPWPWPNDALDAEQQAYTLLSELEGPVIMAGDFNMVPWSARVAGFARAARAQRTGPMQVTFERLPVPLSIDHVLAPGGGHIERRPMFGSDHAGLVATLRISP